MGRVVLVLAAHNDDEIIAQGGTLAKWVENGDRVIVGSVCIKMWGTAEAAKITDKYRALTQTALEMLGVEVVFGHFHTAQLREEFPTVLAWAEDLIRLYKPDTLLTHYRNDRHQDHRVLAEVGDVIARYGMVKRYYQYALPAGLNNDAGMPQMYVDITDTIDKKLKALAVFDGSEVHAFPHARSQETIRAHAISYGSQVGIPYAEAFHVMHEVC